MSTEPSPDAGGNAKTTAKEQTDQRLPFEPRTKRKKTAKAPPEIVASPPQTTPKKDKPEKTQSATVKSESMAVPEVVSQRMVRRMALLCGVPSFLGIATFFGSYFLVTQAGVNLPNVAVVLLSMGFFGLGVLGLSYGVLSASWDEDVPGTKLGWQEFTLNLGRMTSAWRKAGQKD